MLTERRVVSDPHATPYRVRYRPGMVFSWEPGKPNARCRVLVREVRVNEDGEEWVGCVQIGERGRGMNPPTVFWNEADRCDEARGTRWERFLFWLHGYPEMEPPR
jgi:hypothetical protein